MSSRVVALLVALLLALTGLVPHGLSAETGAAQALAATADSPPGTPDLPQVTDEHPAQACVDSFTDVHGLSPTEAGGQTLAAAVRPERTLRPGRTGPVPEGPRRPPRTRSLLA